MKKNLTVQELIDSLMLLDESERTREVCVKQLHGGLDTLSGEIEVCDRIVIIW